MDSKVRVGGTERLDAILKRVLASTGMGRNSVVIQVSREWSRIAGAEVAQHTRPIGYNRGVLSVEVDSAAWHQELATFYKENLLDRIKEHCPAAKVRDLRFAAGGTRRVERE